MSMIGNVAFLQSRAIGWPQPTESGVLVNLIGRNLLVVLMEALLPFVLIFTIIFAILQKSKILGDDPKAKSYNIIVAMVMGLLVVIPHIIGGYYPANRDIVDIINRSLPQVSAVALAIIMAMLLIGIWGADVKLAGQKLPGIIAAASAVIIIYIFGNAAGILPTILPYGLRDSAATQMIIIILVFGLIIWFITKEEKPVTQQKPSLLEELSNTLTGGGRQPPK